jgi:uncharacterized membrane protein
MNLEQLGLFGVFLAGAIPWFEAIVAVPAGIVFGLDPLLTVIFAVAGNIVTIVIFAYGGKSLRNWAIRRRVAKGKEPESPKFRKARAAYEKYGIYGVAILDPILIGSPFSAAASVAAGVKPLKAIVVVSAGMVIWAVAIAWVMVTLGVSVFEPLSSTLGL